MGGGGLIDGVSSGSCGTVMIVPQAHLAFLPARAGFQRKDFPQASQAKLLLVATAIVPFRDREFYRRNGRRDKVLLATQRHAHEYIVHEHGTHGTRFTPCSG